MGKDKQKPEDSFKGVGLSNKEKRWAKERFNLYQENYEQSRKLIRSIIKEEEIARRIAHSFKSDNNSKPDIEGRMKKNPTLSWKAASKEASAGNSQ